MAPNKSRGLQSSVPLEAQHSCGPVWCARRGQSAVVSLVNQPAHSDGPYIQWCSLGGVDVACDEDCICVGAAWVAGEAPTAGVTRELFEPLRDLVVAVETRFDEVGAGAFGSWREWARTFGAGICSASAAWRAAEAARGEAVGLAHDATTRRVGLAAEDAAWAVAHAAAGNVALALQRSAAARRLLKGA